MTIEMLALIGLLSGMLVALLVLGAFAYRVVTYLHHYGSAAAAFITPSDGETTSPLLALLSGVGTSSHMAELGTASGDARMDLGARAQVIEAGVRAKFPILATMADQVMPNWPRKIAKNPMILTQLIAMAGPGGLLSGFLGKVTEKTETQAPLSGDEHYNVEELLNDVGIYGSGDINNG